VKKPIFKPRKGWAIDKTPLGGGWIASKKHLSGSTHRVTVQDARRPSALWAVEKVLQYVSDESMWSLGSIRNAAKSASMTAKITNGKVRCQWRGK